MQVSSTYQVPLYFLPKFILPPSYKVKEKSLENKIQTQIERLIDKVIKSSKLFKITIYNLLPEIFNLRIELIRWIILENIDFTQIFEITLKELNKASNQLKETCEFELFENMLFALKISKKILQSKKVSSLWKQMQKEFKKAKISITYHQLRLAIELEPLAEDVRLYIKRFIDVSLSLEFALILAILFIFKKLKLQKRKVVELSKLLKDLTQQYTTLAFKLGLLKNQIVNKKINLESEFKKVFPTSSIDEDIIALIGIIPKMNLSKEKRLIREIISERFNK